MELDVSYEMNAAALRQMLCLLDQIETTMHEAAYTAEAETRIGALRAQWLYELREAEDSLIGQWHSTIAKH